jgi:hypothetical protein
MRAWYQKDMSVGLLYTCSLGEVRPDCPVALIQNKGEGDVDSMKVIPCEHQLPQQREQVRSPFPRTLNLKPSPQRRRYEGQQRVVVGVLVEVRVFVLRQPAPAQQACLRGPFFAGEHLSLPWTPGGVM